MILTAPRGRRSKIYRDPEVRERLDGLLKRPLTVNDMRRRIVAEFGEARAPSRSAIGRYCQRVRSGDYPYPSLVSVP